MPPSRISGIDPVLIGAHIITALQSIASRNVDPLKSVVVSTTMFHAGTAFNIIPQRATLTGTVRTLDTAMRDLAEDALPRDRRGHGEDVRRGGDDRLSARLSRNRQPRRWKPVSPLKSRETTFGDAAVDDKVAPMMGGEDFSYMLRSAPGAYIFIGNGDTAGLHHPAYDFNDDVLPAGIQYLDRNRQGENGGLGPQ